MISYWHMQRPKNKKKFYINDSNNEISKGFVSGS